MVRPAHRSLYGDLTTLKGESLLAILSGTTNDDDELWRLLVLASELVDAYCNRHFYPLTEARTFDGQAENFLQVDDLLSLTSLKLDDNEDETFETTETVANYRLSPYNAQPTQHYGRPYSRIVSSVNAARPIFQIGQKNYEVTAIWGYQNRSEASGATINEGAEYAAGDTTLTVSDGTAFAEGQTILIESEQLLITSISTNDLTVARGMNGTTDAAHADTTAISIMRWPGAVEHTAMLTAARLFLGRPDLKPFYVGAKLDEDLSVLLGPYRKLTV